MKEFPATPELDKIKDLRPRSQVVSDFYDWLGENGYAICSYDSKREEHYPAMIGKERLIASHFEVDLDKAERERVAILDSIRN